MPLQLQSFAPTGETNYIAKHNANYAAIASAIDSLGASVSSGFGAAISVGQAFHAMFGGVTAVIGRNSYRCTGSGTTLTIAAGYAWFPSTGLVSALAANTTMSFSGLTAGTYYISTDSSGAPVRSTSATNALYAIVWSGSAFSSITRVAALCWAAPEWAGAQTSTALGSSYETLDDRLEAGETGTANGTLARTNQTGQYSGTLGGVNVTLTSTQANNAVLDFSGVLTANVEVSVPVSGPRCWVVSNRTTGNFRVTLKTISGAGVILPTQAKTLVYHDGTNMLSIGLRPDKPSVLAVPVSASPVCDFARADVVRLTLAADSTVTLTGAQDSQKCLLEVSQDSTGGWELSFGPEVNLGGDIAGISLSTAANARDRLGFIYNAASSSYDLVAVMRGY